MRIHQGWNITNYNEQYYFIFNDYENASYLTPLKKTEDRNWSFEKLSWADGPVYFENGFKEEDKLAGKKHPINDLMDIAGHYLIHKRVFDDVQLLEIDNLQFFPAVYIDDDDHWHEQYMLLNIYGKLDCIDFDKSEIYDDDDDDDDLIIEEKSFVDKFYLSEKVLDKIPEENRLIFTIDKSVMPHTFVHQKIKDIFDKNNVSGVKFIRVSDYVSGDEND